MTDPSAPVLADWFKAGLFEDGLPAGLCHPEAILALVGEGPCALVEAPDQHGHAAGHLIQQQEAPLCHHLEHMAQRGCAHISAAFSDHL